MPIRKHHRLIFVLICAASAYNVRATAEQSANGAEITQVKVSARALDRDQKPYRDLLKAQRVFEENRKTAPTAVMRFKVFPRHEESSMQGLTLTLRGNTVHRQIKLDNDGSFALEFDQLAYDEDADVVSNRKDRSLAWRADIRTPGLPPHTRRLGDLRLECKVDLAGTGAGLATGVKSPSFYVLAAVSDPCMSRSVYYGWIADEPIFSVTLKQGERHQELSCFYLYGCHAPIIFDAMDWHAHLRNRFYVLPIFDESWSDDALVVFEPMHDAPSQSDATVSWQH